MTTFSKRPSPPDFNGVEVDAEELGDWLGIQARAVRLMAQEKHIVRGQGYMFRLKPSVREYCANLRSRTGLTSRTDNPQARLDSYAESAALKKATRELAELKRDAIARKLISIEELTDAWGEIVRNVRQLAVSIPARCQEEMPHLRFEDFETFREIVRKALAQAAEIVPDEPPIPGGGEADYQPPALKPKRGRPPAALAAKKRAAGRRISPIGKKGPRASLRPDK